MFIKSCRRWLELIPGPLVREATAFPTVPQPLPYLLNVYLRIHSFWSNTDAFSDNEDRQTEQKVPLLHTYLLSCFNDTVLGHCFNPANAAQIPPCLNGSFTDSFLFIFVFSILLSENVAQWLDLNRRPLESEATTLPTEAQPLSQISPFSIGTEYIRYIAIPILIHLLTGRISSHRTSCFRDTTNYWTKM